MKKTDARIRYTQRVLREAFLALLKQKPINRITVKEVCERAGLNRATFYAHYSDCYQLLKSIEQELLDAFSRLLEPETFSDVETFVASLYEMIERHEEACRVLIFEGASASVLPGMIALAKSTSDAHWKRKLPNATDSEREMLYTYLTNGLIHVIIEGYERHNLQEVIDFVGKAVRGSLIPFQ